MSACPTSLVSAQLENVIDHSDRAQMWNLAIIPHLVMTSKNHLLMLDVKSKQTKEILQHTLIDFVTTHLL